MHFFELFEPLNQVTNSFNIILFGVFAILSIITLRLQKKIHIYKILKRNEFVKNIEINEVIIYCSLGVCFLFLKSKNSNQLSISSYILFMINDKLELTFEIIQFSLLLIFIVSFIVFVILIFGIFYAYHKEQRFILKPSRMFNESKKETNILGLAVGLTFLFGFYPLNLF